MLKETKPQHKPDSTQWFVYLIRAQNGKLYCGITTNPARRFNEHRLGKGASFFRTSPAVTMVYCEACQNHSEALKREGLIKKMGKQAKECMLQNAFDRQMNINNPNIDLRQEKS